MKDCKCHWEGSVFYADSHCVVEEDEKHYGGMKLKHDVPPSVPITLDMVEEELKKAWTP